ncbi:DUF418 domain-containing protein [Nonomuraea sp. NPDC049141]|uniref:DUF418 domain-containing protein n=1 Tax=Nonomuraea sp. NPDC049141 TaxID=3155500 RepID=UPI003402847A
MGDWDPWLALPVFSLLFGIGFALLLNSAASRVPRPRLVLLRRLGALLAIGLVHMLLWPGEILTDYAVVGMLVLLPSTWLPRWAMAGLAAALIPAALIFGGGGPLLIAGLFPLGSTLVRYGVIEQIERSTRGPALLGLVFAAGLASALWVQANMRAVGATTYLSSMSSLADLLLVGVYVCGLLVLLRTPLRPALQFVFAPLGRMALTDYLTATLLVLVASHILGLPIGQSLTAAYWTAGAILTAQWLFCTLWLRRYQHAQLSDAQAHRDPQQAEPKRPAPHARLHDLRHIHATTLLLAGVPVHVVAARLGHADPAITLRVYAHVIQDQVATAADIFAKRTR